MSCLMLPRSLICALLNLYLTVFGILQELESEGNLRQSEHHFIEAGDWKSAVNMYRSQDMWEEAYRVGTATDKLPAKIL